VGDSRLAPTLIQDLIDNAVRYNQPGGRLEVLTSTLIGDVMLKVTNTGPLIPDEHVERLLQSFQRFDDQRSNNRGGLGLSIVAAIADAHHASLLVRLQPTGGLVIEATFPAAADHAVTQNF
jgi:signal transduction histidine kinase